MPHEKGPDEKYCSECAAVIRAKAVVCPKCGCPQAVAPAPEPVVTTAVESPKLERKRKYTVAAVLALVFGPTGAHHFFLGDPTSGICFLGLSLITLGIAIPLLWAISVVQALYYLTLASD